MIGDRDNRASRFRHGLDMLGEFADRDLFRSADVKDFSFGFLTFQEPAESIDDIRYKAEIARSGYPLYSSGEPSYPWTRAVGGEDRGN